MLLVAAALVAPLSGCAMALRVLAAAEAVSEARELLRSDQEQRAVERAPGSRAQAFVTGTGDSGLRLKDRPGGERLDVLPDGSAVVVLCRATGPEIRTGPHAPTPLWSRVRTPGGATGFVSEAYLDIDPAAEVPAC